MKCRWFLSLSQKLWIDWKNVKGKCLMFCVCNLLRMFLHLTFYRWPQATLFRFHQHEYFLYWYKGTGSPYKQAGGIMSVTCYLWPWYLQRKMLRFHSLTQRLHFKVNRKRIILGQVREMGKGGWWLKSGKQIGTYLCLCTICMHVCLHISCDYIVDRAAFKSVAWIFSRCWHPVLNFFSSLIAENCWPSNMILCDF